MNGSATNQGQKNVVLEHLTGRDRGFRFWSTNTNDNTTSRDENGVKITAYKEVWFTDSDDEAIAKCQEFHSRNEMLLHHQLGMLEDMSRMSGLTEAIEDFVKESTDIMSQESTAHKLIRDVTPEECPWLSRTFKKGEVVFEYLGYTYGVVGPTGKPYSEINGETPFFELPNTAFEQEI